MRFRKRSDEIVIAAHGDGMLVAGAPGAVDHLTEQLSGLGGRVRSEATPADAFALAASFFGVAKTSGTYYQLSPASAAQARKYGLMPTSDGFFSATFRDAAGKFAGNAELAKVRLAPEQALAVQNVAVAVALRVAIANVQAAVERVEAKIDTVAALLRAERIGNALGDRRMLEDLVNRSRTNGSVGTTDWSSVAHLGSQIVRDIDGLRAHIRLHADPSAGVATRSRAAAARAVINDAMLRETLALLTICEHNYGLWQQLRLYVVARTEPKQLAAANVQARELLERNRAEDQALLDALAGFRSNLLEPVGFEGLAPIQRSKLTAATGELGELTSWFADERALDAGPVTDAEWPTPADSAKFVLRAGGSTVTGAAQSAARKIRRPATGSTASDTPDSGDGSG
jgi:hypothetical protein